MNQDRFSAKSLAFIGVMGALGNVLSALTIFLTPLVPPIPLGPISISLALDLSHVTTLIGAFYGGPVIGGLTGLVGGLVAANEFGFKQGNLITGFGLPIGKAITGISAGLLMKLVGVLRKERSRLLIIPTVFVSYVPEAIYTAFLFLAILPRTLGVPAIIFTPILTTILIKAFIEMIVMGLILSGLLSNRSFSVFVKKFFVGTTP